MGFDSVMEPASVEELRGTKFGSLYRAGIARLLDLTVGELP